MDRVALARLRADAQRYTTSRRLILRTLADRSEPATIPAILLMAPGLAQSSLYRNLAILERAGLVHKIAMGDEHAHYELGEVLTEHHHHHLVCRQCGGVSDVTLPATAERLLDKALTAVAMAAGFALDDHRLDLIGYCASCRAEGRGAAQGPT